MTQIELMEFTEKIMNQVDNFTVPSPRMNKEEALEVLQCLQSDLETRVESLQAEIAEAQLMEEK